MLNTIKVVNPFLIGPSKISFNFIIYSGHVSNFPEIILGSATFAFTHNVGGRYVTHLDLLAPSNEALPLEVLITRNANESNAAICKSNTSRDKWQVH